MFTCALLLFSNGSASGGSPFLLRNKDLQRVLDGVESLVTFLEERLPRRGATSSGLMGPRFMRRLDGPVWGLVMAGAGQECVGTPAYSRSAKLLGFAPMFFV